MEGGCYHKAHPLRKGSVVFSAPSVMTTVNSPERERIGGGYSAGQRLTETMSVVAFFVVEAYMAARLATSSWSWWHLLVTLVAAVTSALLADLISGLVHWGCDTWGSLDTPLLGRVFIRQFREHHTDPEEINRHDFVETNGTNALLALLPLAVTRALPFDPAHPSALAWAFQVGGMGVAFFVTFTSQAHKWAHAERVPAWVAWMQRHGLVLSKKHHDVHHVAPHLHHYSITGGWVDRWLERWNFFRRFEALITRVTGIPARLGQ